MAPVFHRTIIPVPAAYDVELDGTTVAGVPPDHAPFRVPVPLSMVSPEPGIDQLRGVVVTAPRAV